MDKRTEKVLALAGGVTFIWLVVDVFLARLTRLHLVEALIPFVALAFVVSCFVSIRARLARRADEERHDRELARTERPDTALFNPDDEKFEPFSIGRGRQQFERWLVPLFTIVLALVETYWAWRLYVALDHPASPPARHLVAASLLGAQAFFLFLFSRYLLGLARHKDHQLVRGPGVLLGVACFASLLGAVAAVLAQNADPRADRLTALFYIVCLALLAIETGLNFIWELYRPRRAREPNLAYESRLAGLLTDPAGWVRNIGGALDYQFGFKVSETWLYRFLERALLPLIIFQIIILYLLSMLVFLGPDEEGVLERFGRRKSDGWHLTSGMHFKLPWPFETVRRFPVKRIHTIEIGFRKQPGAAEAEPDLILWSVPHYAEEDQFLVASAEAGETSEGNPHPNPLPSRSAGTRERESDVQPLPPAGEAGSRSDRGTGEGAAVPVNLLSFNMPVQFRISDIQKYAYNFAEPEKTLAQLAYRTLTLATASRDLFDAMSVGRAAMANDLRRRLQHEVDRLNLGVEIMFVGLKGVHPPVSVAESFQSVIGATEEKEAAILKARAAANKVLPISNADAERIIATAEAYAIRREQLAAAEADRFDKRLASFEKAPAVFRTRLYLRSLEQSLRDVRKYIVAASPDTDVTTLNLQEKATPDLFDLGPAPSK